LGSKDRCVFVLCGRGVVFREGGAGSMGPVCVCMVQVPICYGNKMSLQRWQYSKSLSLLGHFGPHNEKKRVINHSENIKMHKIFCDV